VMRCLLLEELWLFLKVLYFILEFLDFYVFLLFDNLELLLVFFVSFIEDLWDIDFGDTRFLFFCYDVFD
jgi:hypothetical protein